MKNVILVLLAIVFVAACTPCKSDAETPAGVRIPVIYIDMDGTLLDSHHKIRPATIKAFKRYKECGGKFGIATGRSASMAAAYIPQIEPNLPLAFFNGAAIATPDGKIYISSTELPEKVWRNTIDAANNLKIPIVGLNIETKSEKIIDKSTPEFVELIKKYDMINTRVDPTLTPKNSEKPLRITIWLDPKNIEPVVSAMKMAVGGEATVVGTHTSVDIVPKGIDKAATIKEILMDTPYRMSEDVFTVGDSGNDVTMLTEAAYSFAMGNCTKPACEAARAIIGSHDTDAIAKMINKVAISPACTK